MALINITRDALDLLEDLDTKVCCYCDNEVSGLACYNCGEYKGVMSIAEWEAYTGETWE